MMKKLLFTACAALLCAGGAMAQTLTLTSSIGSRTTVTPEDNPVTFTLTSSVEAATININVNGSETIASTENTTSLSAEYTFTETRTYNIYGNATYADGTKKSVGPYKYTFSPSSPQVNYPGGIPKMGPVANADGSVTFCLGAPGKTAALILGSWDNYAKENAIMNYQDYNGIRYFWKTIENLDPTTAYIYAFQVDGANPVGDPYARLVLDPSNDRSISSSVYPNMPQYPSGVFSGNNCVAVYQGNINDFNWTDDDFVCPDHDNLIIYELLFRDFTGTEGKSQGNGTVNKALEKIDYLKTLGVNCIELMPINEFNGNNSWGYNPNFFFAPDKAYGTPDDYKTFINTCHENGIAVVLDMVFNQTDWQHPWYQMYPVGSNPMYNATAPHAYSVLNDMNQGHPLIKQQEYDAVRYWMEEYHVDGFRFDLVKGLGDNNSYANNSSSATEAYNQSRIDNMRAIQKAMDEVNKHAIFINEDLAGAQEEIQLAQTGMQQWANVNDAGCQFAMGYNSNAALTRMLATKDGNRPFGSTVSYLESHDEYRMAYKQITWGATGVKGNLGVEMQRLGSAAAQMIMAPGAHMIWMFGELGNDENSKSSDGNNLTGPKKVLWSYYDVPDRRGLYDNYCELIDLRLKNPELFTADCGYSISYAGWALGRYYHASAAGKEIHLLINPNVDKELTMNCSFNSTSQDDYVIASKSYQSEPTFDVAAGKVTIPANCYVVITNKAVETGVDEIAADFAGGEVKGTEWYTLTGSKVQNPDRGIYIQVVKYADGTSRSFKVAK